MKPVKAWAITLGGHFQTWPIFNSRKRAQVYLDGSFNEDFPEDVKIVRVEIREVKPKKRKVAHVD